MTGMTAVRFCSVAIALCQAMAVHGDPRDKVHPKCPGNDPSVSWREYMSGTLPWADGKPPAVATVQFRKAKAVADGEAIGNLPTNACYLSVYLPTSSRRGPKGYKSLSILSPGKGTPTLREGLPGDPLEYEINVQGVLLQFNEAGEVINRRGVPVGNLICFISLPGTCAKY